MTSWILRNLKDLDPMFDEQIVLFLMPQLIH